MGGAPYTGPRLGGWADIQGISITLYTKERPGKLPYISSKSHRGEISKAATSPLTHFTPVHSSMCVCYLELNATCSMC